MKKSIKRENEAREVVRGTHVCGLGGAPRT